MQQQSWQVPYNKKSPPDNQAEWVSYLFKLFLKNKKPSYHAG